MGSLSALHDMWDRDYQEDLKQEYEEQFAEQLENKVSESVTFLNPEVEKMVGERGLFLRGFTMAAIQSGCQIGQSEIAEAWDIHTLLSEYVLSAEIDKDFNEYPYDTDDFLGDEH